MNFAMSPKTKKEMTTWLRFKEKNVGLWFH